MGVYFISLRVPVPVVAVNLPTILERLSINRQQWLQQSQQFEKLYASRFAKTLHKGQALFNSIQLTIYHYPLSIKYQ
jgi:hypothetical protein